MGERLCVRQVVYGNEFEILVAEGGTQDIPSDASKPVNSNFNSH
jgi:hypothetical protein